MSKYPSNVWDQLKGITVEELINAILADNYVEENRRGAMKSYRNDDGQRITIHYHPGKTYGHNLLKKILDDAGWSIKDLKRLKLIR